VTIDKGNPLRKSPGGNVEHVRPPGIKGDIAARAVAAREMGRRKKVGSKSGLAGRANGTIDPWYGCALYDEMIDYALNFTSPWCKSVPSFGSSRLIVELQQRRRCLT
jgi:hypothetical protein